jgi:hypothetical protein
MSEFEEERRPEQDPGQESAAGPKKEVAATAIQTLGEDAVEAKKEIALTVLRNMDTNTQRDVVRQLQLLPEEDRKAIASTLMPTQPVTDWIWKITVGVFAFVFILVTLALCAGALWFEGDVQTLLTVVTTVAGILAGFISGRASTGGTPS